MTTVFDLYKNLDIDIKLDIREIIQKHFSLITQFGAEQLADIPNEELCEMDVFYNDDLGDNFTHLLKHDKVTDRGFGYIMSKKLWFKSSYGIPSRWLFYDSIVKYIIEKDYDIIENVFYKNGYMARVMQQMILEFEGLNTVDLLQRINLTEALKNKAFPNLLFNFRSIYDQNANNALMYYILDNFKEISEYYGEDLYYISRMGYNLDRERYGDFIDTFAYIGKEITFDKLFKIGHEGLISARVDYCLGYQHFGAVHQYIDQLAQYKELYQDIIEHKGYIGYLRSIEEHKEKDNLIHTNITPELFDVLHKTMTDHEIIVELKKLEFHRAINSKTPFYKLGSHMVYNCYDQGILNFYIDYINDEETKSAQATKRGERYLNTYDYKWDNMVRDVMSYMLSRCKEHSWVAKGLQRAMGTPAFENRIIQFMIDNPKLVHAKLMAEAYPEMYKKHFGNEEYMQKLLVSELNQSFTSW